MTTKQATKPSRTAPIYDSRTFEPRRGIGRLLGQVKMAMASEVDQELAPFDITAAQFVILTSLAESGPGPTSVLCQSVSYDQGAMTRMIDRLERKGLVRRARCVDDRRRVNLELTAEGKAVYPKLIAAAVTVQNRMLHGFSKAEVDQLEAMLRKMLSNAGT
jgi:MarR family transcriptional regulator, multiple antibiotic resistance protein MarR